MRGTLLAAALLAAALVLPARAAEPARGEALAGERGCGACHGAKGVSAQPNIPSLAGQQPEFVTLQLILFRERLRDAPPMPDIAQGLADEQVEALAAFYASLPPAPPADRAPKRDAAVQEGAALAQRLRCGICHLPDYRGQNQVPRIAGQREEFLVHALVGYRDSTRHGTDTNMNAVMYGVSDAEIAAIAHYMAHQ
ncbi:c-type cytochrome [Paracraurococcus lichenis]|uniref:C-type cytochrome n=1 Tax=Paracraurococcus lichenis TaxID=3064888 RepID=A0ABT9E6L4_9PROT|nr:c-type cytochrome [Paracraurococcus sp. LOR1-02]MDO9711808.1 c-type cytochrome [Paracraurococcus sp. LOR1-02]